MTSDRALVLSLVGLSAALLAKGAAAVPAVRADFYVAAAGNDRWSGTMPERNRRGTDGPFATLERARDAVRQLKVTGRFKRPVLVLLRGGTYALAAPLVLRPEDSGTAACPITYAAYPGEKPVLSGGRRISGWQPAGGPLWSVELPEVTAGTWGFRQLFVNGGRRARPRLPATGLYALAGAVATEKWDDPRNAQAFRYRPGDLRPDWANLSDVEVVVLQYWTEARLHIATLDEPTGTVTFTGPSWRPLTWSRGYVVENVAEALDAAGEWYLNRQTGVLTYWPLPGEDMSQAEVLAPVAEQLVRFEGDVDGGAFVEHVTLRGLTFSQLSSITTCTILARAS